MKIQNLLAELRRGQQITVVYDGKFEHQRLRISGAVVCVDNYWEILQIKNIVIDFSEIYEIIQ